MLKTNSKQARQNVQAYIMQGFTGENYSIETPETFKDTAAVIMKIFNSEKPAEGVYNRMSEQERFTDWAQGLPSILDVFKVHFMSLVLLLQDTCNFSRFAVQTEHCMIQTVSLAIVGNAASSNG